jgi:hypothetical protein
VKTGNLMRPAFSSSRQAAAFALLLLALLLAPALAGKRFLPPRAEIYSSIWWASGDYPFFYHQIFQEKEPVDILFIGASHIHTAFDTPYVQEQLSRRLGRPAGPHLWLGLARLRQSLFCHTRFIGASRDSDAGF